MAKVPSTVTYLYLIRIVQAIIFPGTQNGSERWSTKKQGRNSIGAFELEYQRILLRIPRTVRKTNHRTNQSRAGVSSKAG